MQTQELLARTVKAFPSNNTNAIESKGVSHIPHATIEMLAVDVTVSQLKAISMHFPMFKNSANRFEYIVDCGLLSDNDIETFSTIFANDCSPFKGKYVMFGLEH